MLARADGHGALHHDDRISGKIVGQLVDDRPDGAQVGVAGVGRRRPHGDEEEVGAVDGLVDVDGEAQPLAVPLQNEVEARLVDGHFTGLELLDPLR